MSDIVYEEVKEATQLISFAAQQTKPIFGSLKIYGTKEFPLYNADEIAHILEVKNIDKVLKFYTNKEYIVGNIKISDKKIESCKLLTRHGMYRIMFSNNTVVGEIFREFVYMVLDRLIDDGSAHLKQIQLDMNAQFSEEIQKATKYLQTRIQNLEHELNGATRITRRATEIMHNKELEACQLSQEAQRLSMQVYNLERQALHQQLSDKGTDDEKFIDYLKAKYLKKYYVFLLPDKDDEYDHSDYNLSNPPDDNDDMYYKIVPKPDLKSGSLVHEIYFENDSYYAELQSKLSQYATTKKDVYKCSLYEITDLSNTIRNLPVTEARKNKILEISKALDVKRALWDHDAV